MRQGSVTKRVKRSRLPSSAKGFAMTTCVRSSESNDYETVIPRRQEAVHAHCIDGEAILYDPRTCGTFLLNSVALHVWHSCDGHTTIGRALDELTERYHVDSATALEHIHQVLTFFEHAGVLAGSTNHACLV